MVRQIRAGDHNPSLPHISVGDGSPRLSVFTETDIVTETEVIQSIVLLAGIDGICCDIGQLGVGQDVDISEDGIPDSVIKTIAKRQPLRAVFRDSSFASSPSKINVGEVFKLLAPDTRVKVI